MSDESAVIPRPAKPRWYPLVWLVLGILVLAVPYGLLVAIAQEAGPLVATLLPPLGAGVAILSYRLLMVRLAKRSLPELDPGRFWKEAPAGLAVGAAFALGSVGAIALLGGYRFAWSPAAPSALLAMLALHFGAAVVEELIFRGIALQAIERMGGTWVALATTAFFFGFAHLGSPNATLWSAFAITCEAGLLLGAAFLWRRHLGFVIGLHFAWNMSVALLGIPVSGHASPSFLATELAGSNLLTGGEFGLEASIVPVVASFFLSMPMILRARDPR